MNKNLSNRSSPAPAAGFTLMELMMTIAVLAILTTLAVPAFTQFIQNNRLAGQANEVVASLQFARTEALKRGSWAELCASSDQASCSGTMGDGWIVQVDPATLEPDETNPLRVWPSPGDKIAIAAVENSARFLGSGCLDHDKNGTCSAHFTLGVDDETPYFRVRENPDIAEIEPRQIRISPSGRVGSCRQDPMDSAKCEPY